MSPFSFLSSFTLPSLSSVNAYLPNLSLPENVQQKLVSFVLRRTLGKFVQHDGLLGDKVETQVASGRIAFGCLELDQQAINSYLPPSIPLTVTSGYITDADIQLPFPNLLSAPLGICIGEVHLNLALRELVKDGEEDREDERKPNLERSVWAVTGEFLSESLSPGERRDLSDSITLPSAGREGLEESIYHAPGGFPVPRSDSVADPPSASILASVIESILSRLHVDVTSITIRLELPSSPEVVQEQARDLEELDISIASSRQVQAVPEAVEIKLERISYGLDGSGGEKMRKMRVTDVAVWIVAKDPKDVEEIRDSVASTSSSSHSKQKTEPSGSVITGQPYGRSTVLGEAESLYESALGSFSAAEEQEEIIDPFGSPTGSDPESGCIDDEKGEQDWTRHRICSFGKSGAELSFQALQDGTTRPITRLELGDIQLALSISDVEILTGLVSSWTSRLPRSADQNTAIPSGSSSTQAVVQIASIRTSLYLKEANQSGLIFCTDETVNGTLPPRTALDLVLDQITASSDGDATRMDVADIKLVWNQSREEGKMATPVTLISLFSVGEGKSVSDTGDQGPENDVQSATPRPKCHWDRPLRDGTRIVQAGCTIEVQQGSVSTAIPGVEVSLDLAVVESMMPFLHQLSTVFAQVPSSDERPQTSAREPAKSEYKLSCHRIRLKAGFPLQDRFYELDSHKENADRQVVLDLCGVLASANGNERSPLMAFDTLAIYFGLATGKTHKAGSFMSGFLAQPWSIRSADGFLSAVCKVSSGSSAGEASETVIRPFLTMVETDGQNAHLHAQLPLLYIWLDHQVWAGMQYLADDLSLWLDSIANGEDLSTRDNIKLVSSRFFGPMSTVSPMDISVERLEGLQRKTLRLEIASIYVEVQGGDHNLKLDAATADVDIYALEGKESGNIVNVDLAHLKSSLHQASAPAITLLGELPERTKLPASARPALSLRLATIQSSQTLLKQTSIDFNLSSSALYTKGREPWMDGIAKALQAPRDVFVDVAPSDITKVSISVDDVAIIYRTKMEGALCFDVNQFRVRTTKRHHAETQDFTLKSDEIRLHAADIDDKATSSHMQPEILPWETPSYCGVAKLLNFRAKLSLRDHSEQVHIDINRMDTTVHGCTDSLRTTVQHLGSMVASFAATPEPPGKPETGHSHELPNLQKPVFQRDIDIVEKAFSREDMKPAEGDLLDDDLPTHRQYLTISRKGKLDSANQEDLRGADGIAIECQDWFEMDLDHHDELSDLLAKLSPATEKFSLRIDAENCNLKFELFDGYDWASTRHVIEVERKAMRRQLQRIRQVLATGQEAPQDVSELSGFAFNSVHLGLPEDTEFSSAAELASAIDISLKNLDNALEGQTEGWQELDDNRPPTATTVEKKAGRSLNRASRAGIEFKLLGIHLQYLKPLFPNSSGFDSSLDLSVESLEILDNLLSSTWKTFLKTRPAERSAHRPLKTEPGASRCQIRWFGSSGNASSEASFKLHILPLRMHVDQDAVEFIKRFMSFSPNRPEEEDPAAKTSSTPAQFIQRAEVSPVEIKLDYKPKRINMNSLRKGHLGELINLFHFEDSKVVLRHATVRGVSGWGAVYGVLLQIWSPDIRANQMSDLVGGAAPVRSLIRVGEGVANLVLLPIEQYQKDGRIAKGIQRGGKSLAKTTTLEAIKITSKLATGTQVILEKAEAALRGSYSTPSEVIDNGSENQQKHSRYAEQPSGAREGLTQAYTALAHDLGSAAQTILAIPMEVHENAGSGDATGRTVIRAVPLAVVQTMMGVTNASRKTLQGIRNQLDSQVQQQLQEKYK